LESFSVSQLNPNPDPTHSLPLEIYASRQLLDWMGEQQLSLALTTYQTSRLILIGVNPEGRISGFERLFERAMGLFTTPERLYLSSKYQIWQLENVLEPGQLYNGYDKLYVPRIGHTTGDLDIHDLVIDRSGRLVFVSSLLNCLATVSQRHSCIPLWQPPFISQLVNEDRCHLNGLAIESGEPRYVTACGQSDLIDGWRDQRRSGGCVIDLRSNEIVCTGLSMPHSPRCYQGRLWLLNSGTGEFGYVDLQTQKFEPVTFCPGYLRGLAFWGNLAIVGLSKARGEDRTFAGLALDEQLAAKGTEPRCGLLVIDLKTGSIVHWLQLEGVITELYDVQVLPGIQRPMALGFQTEEIARLLTLEPIAPLFKD
jgi:protein O-GlcNAc transferase